MDLEVVELEEIFPPLLEDDSQVLKGHYSHFPQEDIPWDILKDSSSMSALLGKAVQGMLLEDEQSSLIKEIESCGDVFPLHLIQKNQILALMDCNIRVAVGLLEKALVSPLASEYFQMFTGLTPSPNSCDLVKQLFEKSLLPKEIVELFVANALDHIRALHDPSKQTRLAQMICIFVTSMLGSYPYLLEDLAIELEYFLVEFSKIKECAILFKKLKSNTLFI